MIQDKGTIILVLYKSFVIKNHNKITVEYRNISALYVKVRIPIPKKHDLIHLFIFSLGAISNIKYFHTNIVKSMIGRLLLKASH